jgi:regulator of RNase E activity RraB
MNREIMREYFTRIEDKSTIHIEINLNAFAYSGENPWLFSVFIKFDGVDESKNGFEEFLETKESLVIALEHEEKAKYVGARNVDGWSELYFYAKDSKELEHVAQHILRESNYVYESSIVKDTKWNFHHKNLTPSELEQCHIQSEKIIFMLKEEDDDLSVVRPVEHYISFELPTQKNRFINTLDIEGYTLKDEISSEEFEHGIALIKEHDLQSETLKAEIDKLFIAIKKCQGYYEGWSTTLAEEIKA